MRQLFGAIFVILSISAFGGILSPDAEAERLAYFTRFILKGRNLEKGKEEAAVQAIVLNAKRDSAVNRSIQFTANALGLINAASKEGNLFKFLLRAPSDAPWNAIEKMGEWYRSKGELPAVKYQFGRHDAGWLYKFASEYDKDVYIEKLHVQYANWRKNGNRPDVVVKFLTGRGWSPEVKSGVYAIYAQLRDMGEASLTGYGHENAEDDVAAYLEAHYAAVYPHAKDIGSVSKAIRPMDFMANKVMKALKSDLARMRKAADAAIQKALSGNESITPTRSTPPAEYTLPTLDGIGNPGGETNLQTYWWKSATTTFMGYGNFRFKSVMLDSDTFISKFLAEGEASRPRGFTADFHSVYPQMGTQYGVHDLKGNRLYEMVLYPWYSSAQDRATYFFGGTPTRGWNFDIESPPADGRSYLPASRGGIVEVRVVFRTDAGGSFRIVCMQPGPSALAFGKVFIRELK